MADFKKTLRACTAACLVLIGMGVLILAFTLAGTVISVTSSEISVQKYREGFIDGYDKGHDQGVTDTIRALLGTDLLPRDNEGVIPIDPQGPKIYPEIPNLEDEARLQQT